jgi:hypothetical protein
VGCVVSISQPGRVGTSFHWPWCPMTSHTLSAPGGDVPQGQVMGMLAVPISVAKHSIELPLIVPAARLAAALSSLEGWRTPEAQVARSPAAALSPDAHAAAQRRLSQARAIAGAHIPAAPHFDMSPAARLAARSIVAVVAGHGKWASGVVVSRYGCLAGALHPQPLQWQLHPSRSSRPSPFPGSCSRSLLLLCSRGAHTPA